MAQPTLTPAYGRDYKSKGQVIEALQAGKDFVFNAFGHADDGRYCSLSDLKDGKFTVRFGQLRKVVTLTKRSTLTLDPETGATLCAVEVK